MVDLLPFVLAHVGDVEIAVVIEAPAPWVAQPKGPYLVQRLPPHRSKRVVRRDGVGQGIDVDAQHLAQQ